MIAELLLKLLIILATALLSEDAPAATDSRMCGEVARDADGRISRSQDVLRQFKMLHPCPSTGIAGGACPSWAIDHVIPLACGGCDSIENLQWLKDSIKSCSGAECKDRWERKIYCRPMKLVD